MQIDSQITSLVGNRKRLFWLLHSLFWIAQWIFTLSFRPSILDTLDDAVLMTASLLLAFGLCLVLRYLYKKNNLLRFSLGKLFVLIIVVSIGCAAFRYFLDMIIYYTWHAHKLPSIQFLFAFKRGILEFINLIWYNSFLFFTWCALYLSYNIREQWNEKQLQLERQLALTQTAQLEMLRYQLNPHFLFNTLSSLRALITSREIDTAEEVVTKVSEFLKYSLLEGENNEVPLSREIEIITNYFDIEKVRFPEQLVVNYSIDPVVENYRVPVFLLHPLIENAIKHGMKSSPSPLQITVKAEMAGDVLIIDVINTGQWIEPAQQRNPKSNGTGLQNTRKRLALTYPNHHTFEIIKENNSVDIRITIRKGSNRNNG